jgi:hypothetical protein
MDERETYPIETDAHPGDPPPLSGGDERGRWLPAGRVDPLRHWLSFGEVAGGDPFGLRRAGAWCLRWWFLGVVVLLSPAPASAQDGAAGSRPQPEAGLHQAQTLVATFCLDCHGAALQKGDVRLDGLSGPITPEDLAQWEDVQGVLAGGSMPPASAKCRPSRADVDAVVAWLGPELQRRRTALRDTGGNTLVRRINHRAYKTMLQSLLGVPAQGVDLLPPDGASYGYDTVGDGLVMTAYLYQRYLDCARRTLDLAIQTTEQAPNPVTAKVDLAYTNGRLQVGYRINSLLEGLKLLREHPDQFMPRWQEFLEQEGIRKRLVDRVVTEHYGAKDLGELDAKGIHWTADTACVDLVVSGFEQELAMLRELLQQVSDVQTIGARSDGDTNPLVVTDPGYYRLSAHLCVTNPARPLPACFVVDQAVVRHFMVENPPDDPREYRAEVFLDRGTHHFSVSADFPDDGETLGRYARARYGAEGYKQMAMGIRWKPSARPEDVAHAREWHYEWLGRYDDSFPQIAGRDLIASGPVPSSWPPPAVNLLFPHGASAPLTTESAREVVASLMRRIYAEAPDPHEVGIYAGLIMTNLERDHDPVAAVKFGIAALLSSPRFLYLDEERRADAKQRKPLRGGELARRLAYALWSDLPDETLLGSAESGALLKTDELLAQAHRLLADPRSRAFREGFTTQWLKIDRVRTLAVTRDLHPASDPRLLESAVEETIAFFSEMLDHDLCVAEFMDSDFAMLNSRLAAHYGIPGVIGDEMRRVALPPGSHRGGVMTQASVLMATGNGMITSPVRRGALLMERLLGVHPGVPPRGVPVIDRIKAVGDDGRPLPTRARLAVHREDHSCARCHDKIDPLGLAFEQYDAIGAFTTPVKVRSLDPAQGQWVACPADVTGTTLEGESFDGPDALKRLLVADRRRLARTVLQNLATYVLGRGIEPSDAPVLDRICADVESHGFGLRRLLDDLLTSELFVDR